MKTFYKKILLLLFITDFGFSQQWMDAVPIGDKRNFYKIQEEFNKYWEGKTPERGTGWKPFKRWEWFWEQRVYPSGILPQPDILKIRMDEHVRKFPKQTSNSTANWSVLGPVTVPALGSQYYNGIGRINCIAVHPTTTTTIFVGAAAGGLWKSTDGGTNWSTTTDNLGSLGVTSIAFDPNNANTMYIATGDGDGNDTYSLGVLKSTNGGSTWATTGLSWTTSQTTTISQVIAHPSNSNIILAVASNLGGGIYKSSNGGTTWSVVQTGSLFKDLEVNKTDPTIWYATNNSLGIYKSTNTGDSFTQLTTDLPTSGFGRIAISIAQSSPSTVYALYVNSDNGYYGLYKTINSGTNWTQQSTTPNILSWDGTGTDGQGHYDLVLDVDPTDPAIVYVGGINLYKSTNSGSTWTLKTNWYTGTATPYVHADQHAFAFLPGTSSTIFSGNDGGIYKSTNSGTTWSDILGTGLAISQFYKLGSSATNVNRIYVGAQDNGSSKYLSGAWTHINGGDGMETIIDYTDENIGYTTIYYGSIYKTTNGGSSFSPLTTGAGEGEWVTPFVINPVNHNSLYLGTTAIYKSVNQGNNWTAISTALTSGGLYDCIAIAPSDTNTIYATNYTSVYKTTNNGTSWSQVTSGASTITYIAVHPTNSQIVYITISGYGATKVQKSTNGGTTWSNVSTGLPSIPTNCIAINPSNGSQIVVGTDVGVYYSSNDGASWELYNTNLPNVIVNELEFHVSSSKLRAATYGRGLWETSFTSIPLGSITGTVFQDVNNNGVYNAGTDYLLPNFKVKISGAKVDSVYSNSIGVYTFSGLSDGTYTVTLATQSGWAQTLPTSNGTYSVTILNTNTSSDKTFGFYTSPPVATAQSVTTNEDVANSITLSGTDAEGVTLTYTIATNPTKGVLSGSAPNLTFTPTANANGSDSFTFTVSDGSVTTSTATVSITITAINDAPVATAQSVSVNGNSTASITLAGTDVDAGTSFTYTVATNPTLGTLSGVAPNLTYTPTADATGSDSFTFTVSDGSLTSTTATVTITITVSSAPQYSLSLNGTNQKGAKIGASNFNLTSALTIEMWIYPNSFTGTPQLIYQGTQGYNIYLSAGSIVSYDYSSNLAVSTTEITASKWTHIAITVNDATNETKFYFNGILTGTTGVSGYGKGLGTGLSNFYLGSDGSGTYNFNGNLKDVRVWSVVRTATEISANMFNTLGGTETGLVAYYKLNQSSGETMLNYSSIGSTLDLTAYGSPTWSATSYPPLSNLQSSYLTTQQSIWGSSGTSASTSSNGFWFTAGATLTNVNYINYGNNNSTGESTSDLTGTSCVFRTGRIWYLDVTGTVSASSTIDLSVATGTSGAIAQGSASNYKLLKRTGTSGDFTVVAQGSSIANTDQVTFGSYSFSDGYYAVGTINGSSSPLPVELKSFTANTRNENVILNWSTVTESANYGFDIERRAFTLRQAQNNNWIKLGFVKGSGISSVENNYTYRDTRVNSGKYQYRLKQIDLDGTTEYSNQVEVQVGILKTRLRSHPNPFNPVTEVRYYLPEKTEVELILFDIMGRRVGEVIKQSEQEEGEYEIKLNSSDYRLTSGIYFLTLKTNKDRITEKIVLLR